MGVLEWQVRRDRAVNGHRWKQVQHATTSKSFPKRPTAWTPLPQNIHGISDRTEWVIISNLCCELSAAPCCVHPLAPFTEDEVSLVLSKLHNQSAAGCDSVSLS
eukprot:3529942-Amphidinium_carterae.1